MQTQTKTQTTKTRPLPANAGRAMNRSYGEVNDENFFPEIEAEDDFDGFEFLPSVYFD